MSNINHSFISLEENIEKDEYLKNDVLYSCTIKELEKYSNSYRLILITARKRKGAVLKQIRNFGLNKYFKNIFVVSHKNTAFEKYKILEKENAVLMVGDTEIDYQATIMANIDFKWVEHGMRNEKVVFESKK